MTSDDLYFARGIFKGLQIAFLLTRNPLFARVQRRYTVARTFFEQDIISATVEGLILLKLYALPSLYRQGDVARVGLYENDIATWMYYHRPSLDGMLQDVRRSSGRDDITAIEGILADIDQRIARFRYEARDQA